MTKISQAILPNLSKKKNSAKFKEELPLQRYIYTLFSTLGRIALAVVTSIIVPKALGPKALGTVAFGQIIVQNIRGLFDFNIGSTFFNLSASKHQSGGITRLFGKIIFLQIIISVLILFILCFTKSGNEIIQGIPFLILLLLLGIEWVLYLTSLSNQLGDSKGISKWPQILILISNLIMTLVIIALVTMEVLTVYTYLITIFIFGLLSFFSIMIFLYQTNHERIWMKVGKEDLKSLLKITLKVSVPLTLASYLGMGIEFFERFLIQYKYGAEEQSYYYVAAKWAAIIIILSSSSLQIFWQSLVKNIAAGDIKKAGEVYRRLDGLLFFLILTLAFTWSFMGKEMLSFLLGKDFAEARKILVVMAFYPVSQIFGQLGTTIAIASGRSKEYLIATTISAIVGVVVSYFLLVPKDAYIPGLGLGSFGLAIKTTFFGLIAVQPITYLNCRYLSISYSELIVKKIKIFLCLFVILLILNGLGKFLLPLIPIIAESIVKAIAFVFTAVILLFTRPAFCGADKNDIDKIKYNPLFLKLAKLYRK